VRSLSALCVAVMCCPRLVRLAVPWSGPAVNDTFLLCLGGSGSASSGRANDWRDAEEEGGCGGGVGGACPLLEELDVSGSSWSAAVSSYS